jgi:hypothetical protein
MATQMDAGVSRTISKVSAGTANVRFESLADFAVYLNDVSFTPEPESSRCERGSLAMSPKIKVELARLMPRGVTYHEIARDDKIIG